MTNVAPPPTPPEGAVLPKLLERRRLVLASALLLALAGVFSWSTMPREEDPTFPDRNGILLVGFPGADAETVERLVVEPMEEHLAEVEQIHEVHSTSRAGHAIVRVEFDDLVYDTDKGWDDVREALAQARQEFPDGVTEIVVDNDIMEQEAIVLALIDPDGEADLLELAAAAERIKREILGLAMVKKVTELGDPGEQITIEYDDAVARRLGVDPRRLGMELGQRSLIVPGGLIHLGPKTATLRPQTEFRSVEEIAATPIVLPSGASVPLGELARVRRGPAEPAAEIMRWNGVPTVGLGVVPKEKLDRIAFGRQVRERLEEVRPLVAPLEIEEIIFQPEMVERRLGQLGRSLQLGIVIVTLVLLAAIGWRLGVLVALVLPLVTFAAMAIYASVGGILHQISIAALVIALGMLVDNAIVMVENIQWRLDRGVPIGQACLESVRELAVPLGTATGTTLAAFVPMLIAKGGTADFTRSIPMLIMLTLAVSYVFAVLVTPVLARFFLKRRPVSPRGEQGGSWPRRIAGIGVRRSPWVLAGAAVLLGVAVFAAQFVKQQFFPPSDRTTVVIDLEMPEGTHLGETDAVAHEVETALAARDDVESVMTFVGRAAPHFYYNLLSRPNSPHRTQIIAEVHDLDAVGATMRWAREYIQREIPRAEVVARRFEQGPPIDAPLEIRLFGHDLEALEQAADAVLGEMRATEGTLDVRHDLSLGVPSVRFEIDDAAAGRFGIARADVALALLGRTLGIEIGQYRVGEDPVPILIRSSAGQDLQAVDLATIDVSTPGGQPVPLEQLARLGVEWRPAAIQHYNRSRLVNVQAQLADGYMAVDVLGALEPRLAALELPAGVRMQVAGELEQSGRANGAILRTMPFGVLLLLFFLLAEFNSFRRVGIVLATVPLAATGVVPGLLLSNQPFGFMSMLGMISLIGIVVNNAIVLLDVVERHRAEGRTIDEALIEAVEQRTRPILLTMATTVAGLSPLAFATSTLWPALAWAMISGLMASTVLTLVVVPALYRVLFREATNQAAPARRPGTRRAAAVSAALLVTVFGVSKLEAQEPLRLTLAEAMERATSRPLVEAADHRTRAAERAAVAERRAAVLPVVAVQLEATRRDRDFDFDTPLGGFTLGERGSEAGVARITQPLLDPARLFYSAPAARSEAAAAASNALRTRQQLAADAARSFVRVLAIDAQVRTTDAFLESLQARFDEMKERVDAGRALEADALKVQLDLESAELDRIRLLENRRVATLDLGRTVGHEGPVEPDSPQGDCYDRDEREDAYDELLSRALTSRPDVQAVERQVEALGLRTRAVRAERLPRLEAQATWQQTSGDPFRPSELLEGSLRVTWNPFASGTRAPRRAAIEAEREALEADLRELRRGIAVGLLNATAQLRTARSAVEVRRRGVELAGESLRVERERHGAGRSTTNDLLDAETELRRQRTASELAQLDVLLAWVEIDLALGSKTP